MKTWTACGGCGGEVVSAEPDPLNTNPDAGICVTMLKDIDGQDVAQRWHASCYARDIKRRDDGALPEPSTVDWEAEIAAVLEAAEQS